MKHVILRVDSGFNLTRKLTEKQLKVLSMKFDYDTICGMSYEEASKKIGEIIVNLSRYEDEALWDYSDGLPNQ